MSDRVGSAGRPVDEPPVIVGRPLDRSTADRIVRAVQAATVGAPTGAPDRRADRGEPVAIVILGDPAGPHPASANALDRLQPGSGPMIRLLGEVDLVGTVGDLTPQQTALVAFLAVNGPATRDEIVEALWRGRRISDSRLLNLVAETRARLGRRYLPERVDRRYRLDGVVTDEARFAALVAEADAAPDTEAAGAQLAAALELVRGVPHLPPTGRYWAWLDDEVWRSVAVQATIAAATRRLVEISLATGDLDRARLACERALLACVDDEGLVGLLGEVHRRDGRGGAAERATVRWQRAADR